MEHTERHFVHLPSMKSFFYRPRVFWARFFIQKMCRTQEEKAARAQEIVVLWLAKKTYSDALALIRSFESHLGLVFANGNLGVRVAAKDVAAA